MVLVGCLGGGRSGSCQAAQLPACPHNALEESCISWGSGEGQAQEINKIVAIPALVKVEMKAKKVAGKDKSDKKYKQKGKG